MRKIILTLGILLLSIILVFANGDHQSEIEEGKKLVESKIDCDKLNDEQLEEIGEYLMEQMHPGEAHETMDKMMGGEGSKNLKQMHINMAKMMYCNEGNMMSNGMMQGGMMGMMNMMGNGMMDSNIMNKGVIETSTWNVSWLLWNIVGMLFWIALIVILILLIIWLYKKITGESISNDSALEILKRRFVKGDINKEEFKEMKKELK